MSNERSGSALATREPEVMDEADSIPVPPQSVAMTGLARAEIDMQIETAKKYPRLVKSALDYALQLATLDIDTAESCFYVLPRGGKKIEGPSVRLAEIFATAWGNLRYGAEILEADDSFIKARGYCFDLQTNTAYAGEVERRITDSKGRRYNDDMIGVTGMAACAIAGRNAVFKIVPRVFVNKVYEAAKRVAVGDATTLSARRQSVIQRFSKFGVSPAQIFQKLGVKGEDDVTLEHLETLIGLGTALKEGQASVDKEFPPLATAPAASAESEKKAASATETLNDLAKKAAGKKPDAKPVPPVADEEGPPEGENETIDPTLPGAKR